MKRTITELNYAQWLSGATECRNLVFQALDLIADDDRLAALPQPTVATEKCVFLGCKLGVRMTAICSAYFGTMVPDLTGRPYKPFRTSVYSPQELYTGYDPSVEGSYFTTPDWLTYKSFIEVDGNNKPLKPTRYVAADAEEILARRLHDHHINVASERLLEAYNPINDPRMRGVVAIMGGHDRLRSDPLFLQVARIARELRRAGFLVATGGGPGLMEAANMGAYFGPFQDSALDSAIAQILYADNYSHRDWLKSAWQVWRANPSPKPSDSVSFGIPTWFYGHEPPNVWATHAAKYFENSLREEGLLAIATHGIVFAEGNGGTVQEIFQDCCQNYYENYGYKSPMILLGKTYWDGKPDGQGNFKNREKPVWPLLKAMAQEKNFTTLLDLTDDPQQVLNRLLQFKIPGQS